MRSGGRKARGTAPADRERLTNGAAGRRFEPVPLPSERGAKAGGLAVALSDALQPGSVWFGWSGRRSTRGSGTTHIQRSDGITYATIDLTEADYRSFYVNFSNGVLWPLLHFRLGLLDFRSEDYDGYRSVNRQFASALLPILRADDMIWVHDYHLIPLAAELRALGVGNRIGFFLHTPFVPPAIFYCSAAGGGTADKSVRV